MVSQGDVPADAQGSPTEADADVLAVVVGVEDVELDVDGVSGWQFNMILKGPQKSLKRAPKGCLNFELYCQLKTGPENGPEKTPGACCIK